MDKTCGAVAETMEQRHHTEKKYQAKYKAYLITKRCFDIGFSICVGMVFLIPVLILAVVIVIKDFGNPFYLHKRVGLKGNDLWVVKLRSMKKDADNIREMLNEEQLKQYHNEYKLDDDPRLIGWKKNGDGSKCFGAWIRRFSMDELPQIYWNILIRGNMSVIGPRPILKDELEQHYSAPEQEKMLSIKPGLTGYWQVYARNNATYETGDRQKMELYYVDHHSIGLDLKILFATVGAVLSKSGAK